MLSLKHSKGTHPVSESWQENTMREARTRKTLWTGVLFNTALLGVLLALIVISPELAVAQCSTSEFATICHRPGQTTERTLHIPLEEWSAHLSHGDREGSCIGGGVCEVGYSVCAGECYSDEADARAGYPLKAGQFGVGRVLYGAKFSHEFSHPAEDRPPWDFGRKAA
jgi:hypothetical protein